MIRKANEMAVENREHMRDGEGTVVVTQAFANEEMTSKTRLCAKLTLVKGASIGIHTHLDEDEIYYILSGRGIVDDTLSKTEVGVGDAVLTGNGESHSISNPFDETLELLAVVIKY